MSKAGFLAMPRDGVEGSAGHSHASTLLLPPGGCPKSLPVPRAGEGPCPTPSPPLPDPQPSCSTVCLTPCLPRVLKLIPLAPDISAALIHAFQPGWRQPPAPVLSQQGGEVGPGSTGSQADGSCLLEAETTINHCSRRVLQPRAHKAGAAVMCCPQVSGCGQRAQAGVLVFALGSGSAITASARLRPRLPLHPPASHPCGKQAA